MADLASFALLALLAQTPPAYQAGRYEMGERLKVLESRWQSAARPEKEKAVPFVSQAVGAFFGQQFGAACRSLDEAVAALEQRPLRPEDSATLRFTPPFAAPGAPAVLSVTWAYSVPEESQPMTLRVGGSLAKVTPGQAARLEISSEALRPSQDSEEEVGLYLPTSLGAKESGIYLTLAARMKERVEALEGSEKEEARVLAQLLKEQVEGRTEAEMSLLDSLALAEGLSSGRLQRSQVKMWPRAKQGQTILRAALPDSLPAAPTLVVAVHGAGGSENLFFEGYGRGRAVAESLRRGWAFVAPRASRTCVADAVAWFKGVTGKEPGRLIVMGHSMGGAIALSSGTSKPSQVVLFAPAGAKVPDDLLETPIWLGVGKQELLMLAGSAASLRKQMEGKRGVEHRLYDPCEHLMIVSEGLKDAFSWLDRQGPSAGG